MKFIKLGKSDLLVSQIALGCMRIGNMETQEVAKLLRFAVDNKINFFDHADIYGGGKCEENFAAAIKKAGIKREDIIIQSKCGIVPGVMYNFSKDYIINSVDGILKRLDTDYLDVLLLHRPDALAEPQEVAEAFDKLYSSGKVRNFGVSNHTPYQIELLKKYLKQDILANQLQLSITYSGMISQGLECNMQTNGGINRDGGILDYCRLNDITVQSWSPFQHGTVPGSFLNNGEKFPELTAVLNEISEKYNTTPTAIATAWQIRHPANIQVVAGTTSVEHLKEIVEGADINISREEWYRLYLAAGHILP